MNAMERDYVLYNIGYLRDDIQRETGLDDRKMDDWITRLDNIKEVCSISKSPTSNE